MTKHRRPPVILTAFPAARQPLRAELERAVTLGAEITLTGSGHYRIRHDELARDEIVSSTPRNPEIAAKKLRSKLRHLAA